MSKARIEYLDGADCKLSQRELELFRYLASNSDQIVSRRRLLTDVWRLDPVRTRTRTVDMHIATLRKKLRGKSNSPSPLVTVRGTGYKFDSPNA